MRLLPWVMRPMKLLAAGLVLISTPKLEAFINLLKRRFLEASRGNETFQAYISPIPISLSKQCSHQVSTTIKSISRTLGQYGPSSIAPPTHCTSSEYSLIKGHWGDVFDSSHDHCLHLPCQRMYHDILLPADTNYMHLLYNIVVFNQWWILYGWKKEARTSRKAL